MTYTTSTWTTTAAARVKADYVAIYRKADGAKAGIDAGMVLTQMDERGGRRTVLGVVDTATAEVIAATDLPGYVELVDKYLWQSRPIRVELTPSAKRVDDGEA